MSKTASLVVRAVVDGKRKNLSPVQAKELGVKGTFYIRTWEGGKEKWQSLGSDASVAKVAVIRKEREFAGHAPATGSQTLREAIDLFLERRALKQDANAIKRWRWELGRFENLTAKLYLKDIDRTDVEAYWRSFKDNGAAPRTIYNRVQSLLTFLKDVGRSDVLPKEAMPDFDEKVVDYYNETNPTELDSFFAACTSEERVAFMFFLYTGCREREVMFACWNEISFQKPYTYTVQPKKDLGFRTKNGLTRCVPIPQLLVDALKTYVLTIGQRRLVFECSEPGKPQGHFLHMCKQIAFRAGLNCGYCINKKGLSCKDHPVCSKWSLHKFRRTWATRHMLNGVPLPMLQCWIGHSDLETLNRYLAHISAKTDLAQQMADNMAKMANVQGQAAADLMADEVKIPTTR